MKLVKISLSTAALALLVAGSALAGWTGNTGDQKISYFPGSGDNLSRFARVIPYCSSELYCAWVQGGSSVPYEIYFSKSTDNGITWTGSTSDHRINASDGEGSLVSLGRPVDLAVNSLGHLIVVWAESLTFQGYEIMLVKSTDGGSTWEHSDSDFPISFIGGKRALEPTIAVDNDDGLHVVWHQQAANDTAEIFYGYSDDGGDSWTSQAADHIISFPDANAGSIADIAIDGNNTVHVIWREQTIVGDFESFAIHYGNKSAGETDFSSETADFTIALTHRSSTDPAIAIGPDNSIHVAYEVSTYDGSIYQGVILYTMSSDGGANWTGLTAEKEVDEGVGDGYSTRDPDIAISSLGYIAICYAWYGEYPHTEPRVSLSTDNGVTWSGNTAAEIIGHWEDPGDDRPGYVPHICVSAGDTLHVVWNEDCMDEGGSSGYYEIMYSKGDTLGNEGPPPVGTIAGTVTEAGLRAPIEGVLVEAIGSGVSDLTNIDGEYSLNDLSPIAYDVSFSHEDYEDLIVSDVIVFPCEVTVLDAEMLPEGPLGFAYLAGDANMFNEYVDVGNPLTGPWRIGGDVTFLVNFFDLSSGNQPCLMYNPGNTDNYPGGPVNGYYFASGDATGEGFVTGGDVTRLVNYFASVPGSEVKWYGWDKPEPQNYYPPQWLSNRGSGGLQPVPPLEELPPGWPNCEVLPPGAATIVPSNSLNK